MTAAERVRSPVVQVRFGPAGAGLPLSYQVPESVALAKFLSLRASVATAVGSSPFAILTQTSKQGDEKFRSPQLSSFQENAFNTVSWGPTGAEASNEGGVQVQNTIPELTIEPGDVFTLSLTAGLGADIIGPATLVYDVLGLSFELV